MVTSKIDEADARAFIEELYRFVLGRDHLSQREHDHWTEVLLKTQDPLFVFRKVAYSSEKQERDRIRNSNTTKYPHGHFYSPVVNRDDALRDTNFIFRKRHPAAVNLNRDGQLSLLRRIAPHFETAPFSFQSDHVRKYNYSLPSYGYGDAIIYWGMLSEFKPARIIEIGSGSSSVFAMDAVAALDLNTSCTFIDPYPQRLYELAGTIASPHAVIETRVQEINLELLDSLEANDILFVDSSHIVKTGSDVHFEITEMLPRLKSGVIVHFHDMHYPFEYGYKWIVHDNNSWNETYFLHSFLMYNDSFRIEFFNHYVATQMTAELRDIANPISERFLTNPGAGLWLRVL